MDKKSYITILLTYIGTIIGAGFASGQEIKTFFVDYGKVGFTALIIAVFILIYVSKKIMLMGYTSRADSYERILTYGFRCKARKVFDYLIIFFLIGTFTTMLSGMGAFFNQNFNIDYYVGALILLVLAVIIVLIGIDGLTKANNIIVPILIFSTVIVVVNSLSGISGEEISYISEDIINPVKGIISGVLYPSYNLIMAISVLPVLGGLARSEKDIKKASLLGGLMIGILGITIYFSLFLNYSIISSVEVPLAKLASRSGKLVSNIYMVSFILAVASTAISTLYGLYSRFNKKIGALLFISVISFLFSLVGFSVLISYLYSFMGYIGFFIILMLLVGYRKSDKRRKGFDK